MKACTIVARNYLAHARVLADSLLEHNPDWDMSVLLLDDPYEEVRTTSERFEVLRPTDVGFDEHEFDRMAMIYSVLELATAVKARLLSHLVETSSSPVAYFDPDIQLFAPLRELPDLSLEHGIVLTPHTLTPMPRDGRSPDELHILRAGIYNLGFIAVGVGAERFLRWWEQRLRRDCRLAPEQGVFVDQRWIDLVPAYFEHHVVRDPGYNVAYWNVHGRLLTLGDHGYRVADRPLRFFHFSGYDPDVPHLLSKHQGKSPRVLLSSQPVLARLCEEYADALLARGYREWSAKPYGLDTLPNGLPLDRWTRSLYRDGLSEAERAKAPEPPDAFEEPEAVIDWLNQPPQAGPVSRYLRAIHASRPDLQRAFPNLSGSDAQQYLQWALSRGREQVGIPFELLPRSSEIRPAAPERPPRPHLSPGINVVGYFKAELGVGEAARQYLTALKDAGIPHATMTYERTLSRQEHPFENADARQSSRAGPYDINLVCVNADVLPIFAGEVGPDFFRDRYSIGVWFWEVQTFPEPWLNSFKLVDEVWVASEYLRTALAPLTDRPVMTMPPPISAASGSPDLSRLEVELPDRFLFLFSFDFLSVFERKNPLAVIEAFIRAFEPGEGPILLVKSINGHMRLTELERLRWEAATHPDIRVVDAYLPADQKHALMARCDSYVSLHRAEGFGLTMAEAMALGKTVIATGYSGNLTFMNEENSFLVPYELTTIPEGCLPYPPGGEWANPDIDRAAQLMRMVYERSEEASIVAARGREDIRSLHSAAARGRLIAERLEFIRGERQRPIA